MDWVNVLVHASFLFGLSPQYAFSNMTPDWSIGLEMQFYAAFPVLYVLMRRYSWVWIAIVSLALSVVCNRVFHTLPGAVPGTLGLFPEPSFLMMKLPLFVIGMLSCEIYCIHQQAPGKCVLMTVGVLLVAAKYTIWVSVATGIILWLGWSRTAGAEGGQLWIRRWLEASLSNRYAKFMADCSYCVYLMHGLFISLVGGGYLFVQPEFLALNPPVRTAILFSVVCPGTYLTAWLLHHILEKPGIELGRQVIKRYLPLGITRSM
jgi:peptidoglycan/LPS O-acetylase OafA/YrhL